MGRRFGNALALVVGFLLLTFQARTAAGDGGEPVPLDGLSADELARFADGRDRFSQVHSAADGLGPVFNGRSCAECHASPGPGGSNATLDHQISLFGRSDGSGGFDPLTSLGGPIRHQRSIREELPDCRLQAEKTPDEANVKARRQPAALYGMGLIEAIPDEQILAQGAAGQATDPGEVSGRVNLIGGRAGRFGWKAQAPTLEQFISQAMSQEIGLTNPLAPAEVSQGPIPDGCDLLPDPEDDGSQLVALVDFVRFLAPQARSGDSASAQRGAQVFQQVGCGACHTPSLSTGPSEIAALSQREVPLYSDLLIHDMGQYLADEVTQGQAGGSDWRTAPLWGLSRKTLYLHDGRTADLRQVIDLHNGEARAARYRVGQLPRSSLDDLLVFLRTL